MLVQHFEPPSAQGSQLCRRQTVTRSDRSLQVEETDEMLAAVDEGIRSIEEQGGTPAEEVRKLIPKWITK
jgi:hypothetical protein